MCNALAVNKGKLKKSCKKQTEALLEFQSYGLDAALQHLCAKKHKNVGVFALGVDEKHALRFLWVGKCGEQIKCGTKKMLQNMEQK